MEINRKNVMEIIEKSGLRPDKDYGQNFLLEQKKSKKIIDLLEISNDDTVLEIGPGIGSLTHFLSVSDAKEITLVDIDKRMIDFLKILYTKNNIELVLNDIRKVDVSNYTKIIGNLPYNITTETIVYLLEKCQKAQKMVLMCQAEAFPRFFDLSGKEYGPASILVHLLGISKRNFVVKPGCFYPVPKCSSLVFTIDLDENVNKSFVLEVYRFAKRLFLNRRKTIYNNLSSCLGNKDAAQKILEDLNIPINKRPEEILPKQYVEIYNLSKDYLIDIH